MTGTDGISVRLLGAGDAAILERVADGVFDYPVRPDLVARYLAEPHYAFVVALEGDLVVGMASGFRYFHPDKDYEFFINECGVGDAYLRRGIGTRVMQALLAWAQDMGCSYCWLGTETDNVEANGLYHRLGGRMSRIHFYEFGTDTEEVVGYSPRIQSTV